MAGAFQCIGFQNTGFQTDCKKKSREAKYHPVSFDYMRKREDDLILAMFVVARSHSKKNGNIKLE